MNEGNKLKKKRGPYKTYNTNPSIPLPRSTLCSSRKIRHDEEEKVSVFT